MSVLFENSSVNLEMFYRTMFCWFHVATADRLGVVKKRTHGLGHGHGLVNKYAEVVQNSLDMRWAENFK